MVFTISKGEHEGQELFAQTGRFFAPVDNQRYLLKAEKVRTGQHLTMSSSLFDKRKEEAEKFLDFLTPLSTDYHLVYTRTEAGRKTF